MPLLCTISKGTFEKLLFQGKNVALSNLKSFPLGLPIEMLFDGRIHLPPARDLSCPFCSVYNTGTICIDFYLKFFFFYSKEVYESSRRITSYHHIISNNIIFYYNNLLTKNFLRVICNVNYQLSEKLQDPLVNATNWNVQVFSCFFCQINLHLV